MTRFFLNGKRLLLFILLAAVWISGCGPQPQDCARADVFCAGLVTGFGPADEGINREAWLGLQDARRAGLAARVDVVETVDARDRLKNIESLAEQGYDVIVTTGMSISDETRSAARAFPTLLFIGVEQTPKDELSNLTVLNFHEEQSGFLAGALAAMITQTGHVAAVCEERSIDSIRRTCDGFRAGALYIDSGLKVSLSYREGEQADLFNDPQWGRAAALQSVNEGADVVLAAGGETAQAALETAAAQGAYVIASETDPYLSLPDIRSRLVSSAVNDIRPGVLGLMQLIRAGRFPAGEYMGSVSLAPFHDVDRLVPVEVKQRLAQINAGLANRSIQLDVPFTSP